MKKAATVPSLPQHAIPDSASNPNPTVSHALAALFTMPAGMPAEPTLEIAAAWYWILLAAIFGLSLATQVGLHLYGLYTISADESERALLAHDLTLAKAIEPFVWPPLPRIVTGLALKLHDDLFITPRIVVGLAGILTLGALAFMTEWLFNNRLIALVAGLLGVLVPQRLILSVVPLADMFAYLFVLLAAGFLFNWLKRGRAGVLVSTSLCLLLASMVRYEAWFFNVVFAFYLAYRAVVRRDLGFSLFVLNGLLLAVFPCAWVVAIYLHDDSLGILSLTRQDFLRSHGPDVVYALKRNVIVEFVRDVALGPALLIGMLTLSYFVVRDRQIRAWTLLLFFVPLAVFGMIMALTFSVSGAAPFRSDGIWVLLLMPFTAWTIVWLGQRIARASAWQYLAVVLMTYVCVVPFALRSQMIAQRSLQNTANLMSQEDRALGVHLRTLLQADDRRILLDAIDNLDFLHVLVLANAPERFTLNVDADPIHVARYASWRDFHVKHNDTDIVRTYLTDRFAIEGGLDVPALRARNIGYVLVRNAAYIQALDANPQVMRQQSFGPWVLFALRSS